MTEASGVGTGEDCQTGTTRFVIITGVSGAGKSYAIKCLEDMEFFCVDNLPATLIPVFADVCLRSGGRISNVALVADVRERDFFDNIVESLSELRGKGIEYEVLFLDAADEALLRRFSETRRKHPLGEKVGLLEGIREERSRLASLRDLARRVIDTSTMTPGELKETLFSLFGSAEKRAGLLTTVVSFGYKYGIPLDSDVVFDVRFLPNPHYIHELRTYTGNDRKVMDFLKSSEATNSLFEHLGRFLEFLLPRFEQEGKAYLTIAIGCTGGRHRSVYVVNRVAEMLQGQGLDVRVQHRDVNR
ncbi:MAG: RNase adapter RapZ [Candidatus Eiseniibacteriota bacterium]|nr:MAG: RNase adapter RapZ [Candidatus Eisenbacteria bacterium]